MGWPSFYFTAVLLGVLKLAKILNFASVLGVHRIPQVDMPLKIQPELGGRPEHFFQSQRGIGSDPAAAVDDVVHTDAVNVHGIGELLLRAAKRLQKFMFDDVTRG